MIFAVFDVSLIARRP